MQILGRILLFIFFSDRPIINKQENLIGQSITTLRVWFGNQKHNNRTIVIFEYIYLIKKKYLQRVNKGRTIAIYL